MDVYVLDRKLRKAIGDEAYMRRKYGLPMTKKLKQRITTLQAAESLADFWPPKSEPERCHELKGNLRGTFSVDLVHPYRLLFRSRTSSGILARQTEHSRWGSIRSIDIVEIRDTHG